jgi:uncharacterized protein with PQ loop repeat
LGGICGSISISCWVVVFSPQIIENFRRSSADGISLLFIIVWLLGDVFNILGAVLQGVLPTMIILALYYTLADIVLLGQCLYYKGFTLNDMPKSGPEEENDDDQFVVGTERDPLLRGQQSSDGSHPELGPEAALRRRSSSSLFRPRLSSIDATHLSPATPLLSSEPPAERNLRPSSTIQTILFNTTAFVLVCLAGAFGWWLSKTSTHSPYGRNDRHQPAGGSGWYTVRQNDTVELDLWGQIFGYLCAVLYIGSRIPQLILNYRRKSTEGVSLLFFLFACVGNLTYVMSILAYEPRCGKELAILGYERGYGGCASGEWAEQYGQYMLVNTSWLAGSAGTLLLDVAIFVQFWIYSQQTK